MREDVYEIRVRDDEPCSVCGEMKELRYGHCWDCAPESVRRRVIADVQSATFVDVVQPELPEGLRRQRIVDCASECRSQDVVPPPPTGTSTPDEDIAPS